MTGKIIFVFLIQTIFIGVILSERLECVTRDYGNGGTVCVCNSTYCDTIEPLDPHFPPRMYFMYTSTKEGHRFNLTKKNFGPKLKSRGIIINVNANVTYQKIFGFGGAFTDSASLNIHSLSENARLKLLESYFSPNGIEYNIGRVPMAGCDFSNRTYTYNDKEYDEALSNFALSYEDTDYKIPDIKKAIELSNKTIHLLAAAWTAPPWMKTNNDYIGFGSLKEEYYRAWSQYHIRFLEEYKKYGLDFWALSTGNEPLNGFIPFFTFNCMGWTPFTQRSWISQHLGPALKNSSFNATKLITLDDQRFLLPWWIQALFSNSEASSYVSGIGVHWYWDNIAPDILLDKTHEAFPDKFILATEACFVPNLINRDVVVLGSWHRAEQYVSNIINDMNHWITGWLDWNLALDPDGGPNWAKNFADAAIIVNKTADEFYKQPMFYAMGHFSKFVPEGSYRIDVQVQGRGVKATGFKTPDDNIVLVLLNMKNADVPVGISGAPRGYANFIMHSKSFVTLIYRNKAPPLFKIF